MLDSLSARLTTIFDRLGGQGRLSEDNIQEALREVRVALLEADVNFKVVRGFIDRVKAKAVGQDVLKSLTPAQQVVKVVHGELGTERAQLILGGRAIRIGGGHDRMLPLLAVHACELGRGRRLAGALQAHQHDHGRRMRCRRQSVTTAAEQLDQFVVHDLDDLLGRRK